jgi:hypothetical protein
MAYWILIGVYLLLSGAVISAAFAEGNSMGDMPEIYRNYALLILIKVLWIPTIILLVILLYMNWKMTLIIWIPSWIIGGKILKKISEYVVVLPLYLLLFRRN